MPTRITKPGKDTSSTLLDDFYLHSDYPLLKVHSFGTFTTNIIGEATITHNLGYKPFFIVSSQLIDPDSIKSTDYYQHDWVNISPTAFGYYEGSTEVTDTQLQIFVGNFEVRPGTVTGFYYILIDEVSS